MIAKAQSRSIASLVDRACRVVNCVDIGVGEIAKMCPGKLNKAVIDGQLPPVSLHRPLHKSAWVDNRHDGFCCF